MNEHHLKEDIFRILRLLASQDDLSQRDLSARLDFSLGKTNCFLKELAKKGLIKIKNFASRDQKLNKVKYILTKEGLDEKLQLTFYFLKRKEKEYLELKKDLEKNYNNVEESKPEELKS